MTAADAAALVADDGRLAARLATLAARAWPELVAETRPAAVAALDAFIAAPSPSRFVAAAHALAAAVRQSRAARFDARLGERRFRRGLERLDALPFVDDATRAALADQPHTGAAGRRLAALAALLEAHAELAARLRSADAAHVDVIISDGDRRARR
jgi:hypothetical protein